MDGDVALTHLCRSSSAVSMIKYLSLLLIFLDFEDLPCPHPHGLLRSTPHVCIDFSKRYTSPTSLLYLSDTLSDEELRLNIPLYTQYRSYSSHDPHEYPINSVDIAKHSKELHHISAHYYVFSLFAYTNIWLKN